MGVSDPRGLLGMEFPSAEEKYEELARLLFIQGKPVLRGRAAVRAADSVLSRIFGMLFSFGKAETDVAAEYERITGNFKRIGKVALAMRFLGPLDRLALRAAMRTAADVAVRQQYGGAQRGEGVLDAARGYFVITDLFNFHIEVIDASDDEVVFKFLECPIGYVSGDDMRVCMATNKWDRHCARTLGARMHIEELIPEGAPACVAHIVAQDVKVPAIWRRYPRGRI